ncbi:hypothetical protein TIFTF001_052856 [Ficus carica]|uniref:Uncharacterized protein n=1 Tax=Ficus carica TaxID=3494 RepID=A0AA88EDG5_FICCA|nr:hypothetical protein TIFTF001_052833 [Ficus carica]GMN72336.1 hypothetical protein TIFTF001_052835 [Ficus carica]GMN72428.1 hypothetical protein TIFTF001_052854 [Ficus carica]GMN72434.1 hypothetical protein TIFTF001_052856 [Ficus carica]
MLWSEVERRMGWFVWRKEVKMMALIIQKNGGKNGNMKVPHPYQSDWGSILEEEEVLCPRNSSSQKLDVQNRATVMSPGAKPGEATTATAFLTALRFIVKKKNLSQERRRAQWPTVANTRRDKLDNGHGGRRFSDGSDGVEEAEGRFPMGDRSAPDLEIPHCDGGGDGIATKAGVETVPYGRRTLAGSGQSATPPRRICAAHGGRLSSK